MSTTFAEVTQRGAAAVRTACRKLLRQDAGLSPRAQQLVERGYMAVDANRIEGLEALHARLAERGMLVNAQQLQDILFDHHWALLYAGRIRQPLHRRVLGLVNTLFGAGHGWSVRALQHVDQSLLPQNARQIERLESLAALYERRWALLHASRNRHLWYKQIWNADAAGTAAFPQGVALA